MTASEILRLLQQVPPRYELVVMEGDVERRIKNLEWSHEPAQVTLRIDPVPRPAPAPQDSGTAWPVFLPEPEATIAELNGEVPPLPVPVVTEVSENLESEEPDAGEVHHARTHPEEVAAPIGTDNPNHPQTTVLLGGAHHKAVFDAVIEEKNQLAAPAKRTRKPKNAPSGTA